MKTILYITDFQRPWNISPFETYFGEGFSIYRVANKMDGLSFNIKDQTEGLQAEALRKSKSTDGWEKNDVRLGLPGFSVFEF